MYQLDNFQVEMVSGGDYELKVDISAPDGGLGKAIGFFLNGYIVNGNVVNKEIIRTFMSLVNRYPYLPGVSIINMELTSI